MNFKRYLGATIALFVFVFLYEWLVHGYLLMDTYKETPKLWRDFAEMQSNMPLMMGIQLFLSAWMAFIFTQIFKEGGFGKGLLFGLYFGVFAAILTGSWYLWLPVSTKMGWSWLASGFAEWLGGGIVLGSVYRR